jgi:hypothetical protein
MRPRMSDQPNPIGGAPQAQVDAASQASPQTVTATRPDYLPEAFWDEAKGEPKTAEFKNHVGELEKFKAETEAKRAAAPPKPDDYKFIVPSDVKLPAGYEPNEKDPKFVALRKIAHEEGWSQAAVNRLIRLEAESLVAADAKLKENILARDKALGENGAARVAALAKFIDSHWPDPNEAAQIRATMWTPVIVNHFETFQRMLSSQGVHSFSAAGRADNEPQDTKPPGWAKMSAVDRRAFLLRQQREAATAGKH